MKEIDEDCFNDYKYNDNLKELTIPTTVKEIPKNCLEYCNELTNITLPLKENQMIC